MPTTNARVPARNILLEADAPSAREASRRAMRAWPIELRALFDPAADRQLAERIEAERAVHHAADDLTDDLPF